MSSTEEIKNKDTQTKKDAFEDYEDDYYYQKPSQVVRYCTYCGFSVDKFGRCEHCRQEEEDLRRRNKTEDFDEEEDFK